MGALFPGRGVHERRESARSGVVVLFDSALSSLGGVRFAARVVVAVACVLLPVFKFDGPTGVRYLLAAMSLARQGDADVSEYVNLGDEVSIDGQMFVAAAPGPSLVMVPIVWIGDALTRLSAAGGLQPPARPFQLVCWLLVILPTLVACVLLAMAFARRQGHSVRRQLALGGLVLFGTPLAAVSSGLRQNVFLVAAALTCLLLVQGMARGGTRRFGLLGFVCGVSFVFDIQGSLIAAATVIALGAARLLDVRSASRAVVSFAAGAAGHLVFNQLTLGSPFSFAVLAYDYPGEAAPSSTLARVWALLLGSQHGALLWIPAVGLGLWLAARSVVRAGPDAPCAVFVLALASQWLLLHSLVTPRSNDFALGPRYALMWLVPLVCLLPLERRSVRWLAASGVVINYAGCVLSQSAVNLAPWESVAAVFRFGPYVQWTSVLIEPRGTERVGGVFPIGVPTTGGALLSAAIVALGAAAAYLTVRPLIERTEARGVQVLDIRGDTAQGRRTTL